MNVQVFGHIGVDMLEKAEVLLMAVTVSALSENFAGGDVEGRKQCRGAVPNVIMRHALDISQPHGQEGLCAV